MHEITPATLDLRSLKLAAGEAAAQTVDAVLAPYRQGGYSYVCVPDPVSCRIDVSAMLQGWALRLRFTTELHGPCSRCLEPATLTVSVDSREVHDPESGEDDLRSDFVSELDVLDVTAWAQDALGLEFPPRVLCSEDCRGLCPTCGANRNILPCECPDRQPDPRWEKLRHLLPKEGGPGGADPTSPVNQPADDDSESPGRYTSPSVS